MTRLAKYALALGCLISVFPAHADEVKATFETPLFLSINVQKQTATMQEANTVLKEQEHVIENLAKTVSKESLVIRNQSVNISKGLDEDNPSPVTIIASMTYEFYDVDVAIKLADLLADKSFSVNVGNTREETDGC